MKWQQKTPAEQTIYRALSLHVYGGGIFFWTDRLKNQEDLITFLKGQDVRHGSS